MQEFIEAHASAILLTTAVAGLSLGLFLRFFALGRLGINSDEAVYTGQGATLAGIDGFAEDFSIFRAHPLLFQYVVSIAFRLFGFHEITGRVVASLFGVGTIWMVYLIGKRLIHRRAGIAAAVILAVMPYHVIVSRQALLEAPMVFFYAAAIYGMLTYFDRLDEGAPPSSLMWWSVFIGSMAGLSFMAKEVAGMLLVVVYGAMLVTRRFNLLHAAVILAAFAFAVSPHLLALQLGPASEGGGGWAEYVIWQLARPANHPLGFYIGKCVLVFRVAADGSPDRGSLAFGAPVSREHRSRGSPLLDRRTRVVLPGVEGKGVPLPGGGHSGGCGARRVRPREMVGASAPLHAGSDFAHGRDHTAEPAGHHGDQWARHRELPEGRRCRLLGHTRRP